VWTCIVWHSLVVRMEFKREKKRGGKKG
jgi:hypothetical protein